MTEADEGRLGSSPRTSPTRTGKARQGGAGHRRAVLLATVLVIGMIALLAASYPDPSKLLCPINYGFTGEDCQTLSLLSVNLAPTRSEYQPALRLEPNQLGVLARPGDHSPSVVRGIGYQAVPAAYTLIYPTSMRTLKTGKEWKDPTKCPLDMSEWGECDLPLDGVRLKGGVTATVDYEIDYVVVADSRTAPLLASLRGYRELVQKLTSYVRAEFRNSPSIDPQLLYAGDLGQAVKTLFRQKLAEWQYAEVLDVRDLRVRSIEVSGIDATAELQNQQGLRNAEAFATQQAIACGQYQEEGSRAYCMAVYTWSQKRDAASPILPPTALPSPATADTPGPIATPPR